MLELETTVDTPSSKRCAPGDESPSTSAARQRVSLLRLKGEAPNDIEGNVEETPCVSSQVQGSIGRAVPDQRQQRLILESLCASRAVGLALDPVTLIPQGRVQLCEDGSLLVAPSLVGQQLLVQVGSWFAAYRFRWEQERGCIPDTLEAFADRLHRRTGVSSRVRIKFSGAALRSAQVEAPVLDVSSGGLAFAIEPGTMPLQVGDPLVNCIVSWKRGRHLQLDARVAHISADGARTRIGIALGGEPVALEHWRELVEELQFSESLRGRATPELLWAAYTESGYLQIAGKEAASFETQRTEFETAQALLANAPHAGAIFSAGRFEQPEAYVHQIQAWPGAWLLLHLCRLPHGRTLRTSDDGILLNLYEHCYEFVLANHAEWLVTYTHADDTAYSHRIHCEYARTLPPELACVVPFEAVEVTGVVEEPVEEWRVHSAAQADIPVVQAALFAQLPLEFLKSAALHEQDLGVHEMHRLWWGSGLERRRQVLVARRGRRIVAAAILDFASRGLHLYGLLNKVRLVEIDVQGREAFDALLGVAYKFFAAAGHSSFVYFRDPQAPLVSSKIRHSSMGMAHINVITRAGAAGFLEHVYLLLSRTLNHARSCTARYRPVLPGISPASPATPGLSWLDPTGT